VGDSEAFLYVDKLVGQRSSISRSACLLSRGAGRFASEKKSVFARYHSYDAVSQLMEYQRASDAVFRVAAETVRPAIT
jgi:hypothetical protein